MDIKGSPPLILLNTEITAHDPYLYVYGRLEDGRSICARTNNFYHYFYAYIGDHLFPTDLDFRLHEAATFGKIDNGIYVHSVEKVQRKTIMGYQPNGSVEMYKITMISYKHVSLCQRIFENGGYLTYEASIKYELRFMIDRKFGGFDWLSITKYRAVPPSDRVTNCTEEVEFDADSLNKLGGNKSDFHQVITLAFDIEACKGGNGRGFVIAQNDSVSQIGCTLYDGNYTVLDRRVFSLVPVGRHVSSLTIAVEEFEDECALLIAFRDYIVNRHVDIITGYNIKTFDLPYLYDRAKALGIGEKFSQLGKLLGHRSTIRKTAFQSAGKGARVDFAVAIDGRFDFDMIKSIKEQFDLKLRSYTLGYVANHVLGKQKVEMPYQNIPIYQAGTDEQRAHLCYYCWWDADLCLQLMKKRMTLVNYIESARVAGTPMKYLLDRGQQIRTTSLLIRYGNDRGFVLPSSTESQNDEDTAGATVKDPICGMYVDPVVTLDFQSLYPSIIRAANICYSTKAPTAWARANLKDGDYVIPQNTSGDFCFVKRHIIQGLLPQMEETLFARRNEAKAQMKAEKDPDKKNVYNSKQNAIKVEMNSAYGYMKANTVCDKDLMEAVTGIGRFMLDICTEIVEREFPGSKVIYGDTDSLFICFGKVSVDKAFELGQLAADMCTAYFEKIDGSKIRVLMREKLFLGFLLIGKKKYAGNKCLGPGQPFKRDETGLENVRRDNALIGSETLDRVLALVIEEHDYTAERSIAYVKTQISELLMGRLPLSKLIISKNLSKSFKHYENSGTMQPHVELAKKIAARSHLTGEQCYYTGDRVPFVMLCGDKNAKGATLAEDPLYALNNRLPIDYRYYIENQMMRPLLRILTPILAPQERKLAKGIAKNAFEEMVATRPAEDVKKTNKKGKKVPINDKELRGLTAYKALFIGSHMMATIQKVKVDEGKGSMMGFVKKMDTCLSCKCGIREKRDRDGTKGGVAIAPLCTPCEPRRPLVHVKLQMELNRLEQRKWSTWTACQRCDGKLHGEVMCANKDCANFYERHKVELDLEDLQVKMGN